MLHRAPLVPMLVLAAACAGPPEEAPTRTETSLYDVTDGFALSAEGLPIAYASSGSGPSTLLFIHDWSCDRWYWARQAETFSVHHRVVAIDLPGHGDSGTTRENWTIEAYGEDVQAVVEALDLRNVVLVGHAMGGYVALEGARRLTDRVVGVVGVESLHGTAGKPELTAVVQGLEEDFVGTCTELVRQRFLPDDDARAVQRVTADVCSADPAVATGLMRQVSAYDATEAISALRVPIRVLNGTLHPTRTAAIREYADFDAVILGDTGHFPMFDSTGEFNRRLAETIRELTVD